MPAHRLTDGGSSIARSDIVGADAKGSKHLLRHISLAAKSYESVRSGDSIDVNHMGPPLERNCSSVVHAQGTAELNDDELNQIELFIDEHLNEQEAQARRKFANYIVHPHADYSPDQSFRRFSCAGYVVEAYAEAGINVIDLKADLPSIYLDTLFTVNEDLRRIERNPQLRQRSGAPSLEELGLEGDEPWPVLLPGYVFHSLARDAAEIRQVPYRAIEGDEKFPREN